MTSWAELSRLSPAAGSLLVATPALSDANFVRTVVYVLEHDAGGTLAVVLNRPSRTPVGQVLPDWQDAVSAPAVVFGGGPVQPSAALCVGLVSGTGLGVRHVLGPVAVIDLDSDVSAVTAVATRLRVFAGHAGWTAGQLAAELEQGAWWVVEGDPQDLFSATPRLLWQQVLRRQPAPLSLLSTYPRNPLVN